MKFAHMNRLELAMPSVCRSNFAVLSEALCTNIGVRDGGGQDVPEAKQRRELMVDCQQAAP